MSTETEAEEGQGGRIEPERPYSPAELAEAVGLCERSIRDLYISGELRCRRIGPRRGRVLILGRWWQQYERRGEQGPEGGRTPRARATTPASRPARRGVASAADVMAELERALKAR